VIRSLTSAARRPFDSRAALVKLRSGSPVRTTQRGCPRTRMLPRITDPLILSKLSRLAGDYLPKIAGATKAERKRLLCELVSQIFDVWTEQRAKLFKSQEDFPNFEFELGTHLERVVMPLLGPIRLNDTELEAIKLAVAGRKQHWLGVVATRNAPAEIPAAEPSGTTFRRPVAVQTDDAGVARVGSDPIAKKRRQAVDDYIAEAGRAGIPINRSSIWRKAGYKTRSEFERWQRNDPTATPTADKNITRVLTEKPHLKKPPRS